YFSEEYRKLLEDRTKEYALIEKRGKKYAFVEKDYKWAKLYDLSDEGRNCHEFKNPFGAQTPFIRIEAMLSSKGENPFVVFPLDETKALSEIKPILEYPTPIDLSNNLALKVKIEGNGKKGSAVAIKMRSANDSRQLCEYFIETDYKGEREFILIETDTGSRPDLPFDDMEGYWTKWGTGYRPNAVKKIEVLVTDEAKDVKMSSIVACEELYDILKNPKVKIGDSEITFHCELTSSDYIEFDGKSAKVFDRFGNEKEIFFEGNIRAPRGRFKATLTAKSLNRMTPRAKITLGFTGKEINITK
ncbi:MAG: hypothetical protein IIV81_01760, partial [Clostridia bacterium]|nr:hypothetical protein [Clostridia bacterium]